ncbi:hypothetical protein E2I00_014632, partial [Balaenoptera physalus]
FNFCVILSALTAVYHRAAVAPAAAGVRETRADGFLPKVFLLIHSLCNPFLKRFLGYIYGNKRRNSSLIMDFEERLLNTQRKR